MSLRQAIKTYVLADPAITALIGQRFFLLTIPEAEGDLTAVAYQLVSTVRTHSKAGPTGYAESRVQFTIVAKRHLDAMRVADALRARLDGFSGDMGGVHVHQVRSDVETDQYDELIGRYLVTIDFIVSH